MALDTDPYHVLGLPTGAPLAEVKRAYRRLVKVHHPDAAGDGATTRFLAIQAAYEALVGADGRGRRRPGVPREAPWQADPDRTRTTRESWQRRAGGRPRPGATGDGGAAGPAGDNATGTGPASRAGSRRRTRPSGTGENRPPDRATPGSTTYDSAEHEPFDPEWSGASWYGQSSGTYWTINPKEYADPRKHGPEYQARGRRRDPSGEVEPPLSGGASASSSGAAPSARGAATSASGPGRTASDTAGTPGRATGSVSGTGQPARGSTTPASGTREPASRPSAGPPPPSDDVADGRAAPASGGSDARVEAFAVDPLAAVVPGLRGRGARVGLALIGWPPIGLALAFIVDELSGCGRFSANCVEVFSVGSWVAQAVVIGLLLLLPTLAAIAATGSIAVLATSIPAAVVLSAVGGSREPAAAGAVLLVTLVVAWFVGVTFAVTRRSRTVPP